MEHHCGPFTAENIGVTVDGGYGEYFLVKHSKYLFDAGDTPDELAGTYACRGLTAYSALKKANPKDTWHRRLMPDKYFTGFRPLQVINGTN